MPCVILTIPKLRRKHKDILERSAATNFYQRIMPYKMSYVYALCHTDHSKTKKDKLGYFGKVSCILLPKNYAI